MVLIEDAEVKDTLIWHNPNSFDKKENSNMVAVEKIRITSLLLPAEDVCYPIADKDWSRNVQMSTQKLSCYQHSVNFPSDQKISQ